MKITAWWVRQIIFCLGLKYINRCTCECDTLTAFIIQFQNLLGLTQLVFCSILFSSTEQTYFKIVFFKVNYFRSGFCYIAGVGLQSEEKFLLKYVGQDAIADNRTHTRQFKQKGIYCRDVRRFQSSQKDCRDEHEVNFQEQFPEQNRGICPGSNLSGQCWGAAAPLGCLDPGVPTDAAAGNRGLYHCSFGRVSQPIHLYVLTPSKSLCICSSAAGAHADMLASCREFWEMQLFCLLTSNVQEVMLEKGWRSVDWASGQNLPSRANILF